VASFYYNKTVLLRFYGVDKGCFVEYKKRRNLIFKGEEKMKNNVKKMFWRILFFGLAIIFLLSVFFSLDEWRN